ncbi:DUF4158 domain-containing protein [Bradyrhizobium sp. LMTR 3]|uniref:DUF4158 domain-containing protein n=1 Tax=Bradyrhizobium sp. LMTR 3 TaxID=189873 RepID=UPI0009FC76C8|nr:DUF4158 domain-containing protein [Bradyrhizobium sp. LMTR 3]
MKREKYPARERRSNGGDSSFQTGARCSWTADCIALSLRREDRNRLGAALQLALFRHPAMTMAQVLNRSAALPEELVTFIAEQLELPAEALADYASRDQTMTDHARELAAALGLRSATRTDIPFMIDAAARSGPLLMRVSATSWMRSVSASLGFERSKDR